MPERDSGIKVAKGLRELDRTIASRVWPSTIYDKAVQVNWFIATYSPNTNAKAAKINIYTTTIVSHASSLMALVNRDCILINLCACSLISFKEELYQQLCIAPR